MELILRTDEGDFMLELDLSDWITFAADVSGNLSRLEAAIEEVMETEFPDDGVLGG